jgi:hypothetical protein
MEQLDGWFRQRMAWRRKGYFREALTVDVLGLQCNLESQGL